MPYKNQSIKMYEDRYYHVYSRGINKTKIFLDKSDYKFFLYQLKKYLTKDFKEKIIIYGHESEVFVNSVYGLVILNAFCLMPNHFHLLLQNKSNDGITKLMRRVLTAYTIYFNHKYKRQGNLFQGSFRSVPIFSEYQFTVIGIYLHLNPVYAKLVKRAKDYLYSSYNNYLNHKSYTWLSVNQTLIKQINFKTIELHSNKLNISDKEKADMGILD